MRYTVAAVAVVAVGCGGPAEEEASLSEFGGGGFGGGVTTKTVCFTVHNPGDPIARTVTGTRFAKTSFNSSKPVVLIQHGAVSTRTVMNGLGRDELSLALEVAGEGYGVFTVDRLGYGQSPYNVAGGGFTLNFNSYIEMTHEIIDQIHNGTYRIAGRSGCPSGSQASFGNSSVSLVGHSIAGGTGMAYASRYHDIDALIPIGWTNQGVPSTVLNAFGATVIPTCTSGADYTPFFQPGPQGFSTECIAALFYGPGARDSIEREFCSNTGPRSPCGELLGALDLQAYNVAMVGNVTTPTLLVWGDRDDFVTHAGYAGPNGTDPDLVTPEEDMWENQCNCDVSSFWQTNTGHAEPLHNSVDDLGEGITDWLDSRGISP